LEALCGTQALAGFSTSPWKEMVFKFSELCVADPVLQKKNWVWYFLPIFGYRDFDPTPK
jgi:hypothetical protein